jgi:hypothetical protein
MLCLSVFFFKYAVCHAILTLFSISSGIVGLVFARNSQKSISNLLTVDFFFSNEAKTANIIDRIQQEVQILNNRFYSTYAKICIN